jgi:hypothetical protein
MKTRENWLGKWGSQASAARLTLQANGGQMGIHTYPELLSHATHPLCEDPGQWVVGWVRDPDVVGAFWEPYYTFRVG